MGLKNAWIFEYKIVKRNNKMSFSDVYNKKLASSYILNAK